MKKILNLAFILNIFCLSACAAPRIGMTLTDEKWNELRLKYKEQCLVYNQKFDTVYEKYKKQDSSASVVEIMRNMCKDDSSLCSPPSKPEELVFMESKLMKPYTEQSCVEF